MKLNNRALMVIGVSSILLIAGAIGLSSFDDRVDESPNALTEQAALANGQNALPNPDALAFHIEDPHRYQSESAIVQPNEFLSTILQRYDVDLGTISQIAENAKSVYDVKRISAGHSYTMLFNETGKAEYFIYQPNKIDFVVYALQGDLQVNKGQKHVTSNIRAVAGTIEQSLYQALEELSVNPDMANKLAEIFGWAVNFYGIQKGDWFKIQFEQLEVDGEVVNSGKVLAAEFGHRGKAYQAYYFETEEGKIGTYYDENGKSLRRAFLKSPLKYSRISSRFSPRRLHPVQKVWKAHLGTDFAAPHGTPILATGDGIVIASTYAGGNGNYVKIQHDNVYATQYLHMSKRAVKRGDRVKQGQVIGYVGSTGLATGPHVCYRFWKNGKQVDALKQEFPSAEPIAEKHRLAFNRVVQTQQIQLAQLDPFRKAGGLQDQLASFTFDMKKWFAWDDANAEENGNAYQDASPLILIKKL